jgi:indole-3-glycerol phosphate synthase
MPSFLGTIVTHIRGEVERRKKEVPESALRERPLFRAPTRGFANRLAGSSRRIIAEVKRASPSKGWLRADFDPVAIARQYAEYGASAISVLTEEKFFQGSLGDLEKIRTAVSKPLLRKDFIIDPYQITEAKSCGADAVLLIAALLDPGLLSQLRQAAVALGLDVLVEVHSERELNQALGSGAALVGINNRDLETFAVNLETTRELAPLVPPHTLAICESGIDTLEQIREIEALGIHVFLIGESLMRAPQPGVKLKELLEENTS